MKTPIIGILGGMGPRATVVFQQRLFGAFEGSDQELPRVICVNDGNIPDRTEFLTNNGTDPLQALLSGANILVDAGVSIICMPCNTAHAPQILGRLQGRLALPIVDMPAATLACAEELSVQQLLVLATRGTKQSQVYQLRSFGIACKFPDAEQQLVVDRAIEQIKSGDIDMLDLTELNKIISTSKCDAVALACTELSLLQSKIETNDVTIIDSMDSLVTACLKFVSRYNSKKRVSL